MAKSTKSQLNSYTLCDGLSGGAMGEGLAAPAPPPPPATPAHRWCRAAAETLGVQCAVTSRLALPCAKIGALLPPWCA